MPWACKQCGAMVLLDDIPCPTCAKKKSSWTLHAEATRQVVVSKKKLLDCRRGRSLLTTPDSPRDHEGVAWPLTETAAVLPKAQVQALRAARRLPAPLDLWCVRVRPTKLEDWAFTVDVLYE